MSSSPADQLFSGPWLPWFHGDFLKSTQGWTITERGVYFLLLGASWEMGPLPDDRRRLAGVVGAQLDEFDEAWKTVKRKFVKTESGLINHRLEDHRGKQAIRSEKARQSANNRWQGKLALDADADADADANGHANAYASGDARDDAHDHAKPMLEGMRSGCSSELISQNSKKGKSSTRPAAAIPAAFHTEVIATYHRLCPHLPGIKTWPKHRKDKLTARIRERCADGKPANTIEYWQSFFESVAASDFLSARTAKPFSATIDWLLGPENFPKVIEGNYANRKSNNGGAHAHG
jgi:uncharacterized protein YdaU (DUF1376 family)